MIIRVFRARTKPNAADELTRVAEEVAIPFVDQHEGLVARHAGRAIGSTGEELVMITVWESLEAMKGMTGDEWEKPVLPYDRADELIEEMFLYHYATID